MQVEGRGCILVQARKSFEVEEKYWFFPSVSLRMENSKVFSLAKFPKAYQFTKDVISKYVSWQKFILCEKET